MVADIAPEMATMHMVRMLVQPVPTVIQRYVAIIKTPQTSMPTSVIGAGAGMIHLNIAQIIRAIMTCITDFWLLFIAFAMLFFSLLFG